jgi:ribosomal protein S18 acetylase RimI-like enzyme
MPVRRRSSPRRSAPEGGIEIRPAGEADVPALARLGAWLARWHHEMDPERFMAPEPLEPGYAWWLGKEVVNPRAVVLAAVRRGRRARVVGYAYGRLEGKDWNTLRDACGVGVDLVVEPRARGGGVGRRLVEELVRRLGERGAPRVVIDVATGNAAGRRFFARLGFRPTMLEMAREVPAGDVRRGKGRAARPGRGRRASRQRRDVGS